MTDPGPVQVLTDWLDRCGERPVRVVETLVSVVAVTADRVHKLKKPVSLPFVDLSTPEQRERLCHREVELNRRLSPDVYIGVVEVTDAEGTVVDHAVEMLRLPDARRLSALVAAGGARPCVDALADRIAMFHARADTSPDIAEAGSPGSVRRMWEVELDEVRPFVGDVVDEQVVRAIERLALRYVEGRTSLFEARVAQGRVRDGHGDLLADDVFCLDDGPRALDCLEFDDRLRYGDCLADVAFLAMDLERLGAPDLARGFLDRYRAAAGDTWPESLEHHWIAHRAHVRGKVAAMRASAGDVGAAAHACRDLDLALGHLRLGRVGLVLVGGLPGTGKSTLAAALAADGAVMVVRSDVVRKEIAGGQTSEPAGGTGVFGEGLYRPEVTERVYGEIIERARRLLGDGLTVVLDASWSSAAWRETATTVARACAADLVAIECRVTAEVAAERIRRRAAEGTDPSDADAAIARAMSERFDDWPDATVVDTGVGVSEANARVAAVLEAWREG